MESGALDIFTILLCFFSTPVFGCGRVSSAVMPLSASDSREISEKYPWHAAIYHISPDEPPRYVCGGTLIDHNKVITAAFCVAPNGWYNVSVTLGKVHRHWDPHPNQQNPQVDKIIIHEDYVGASKKYENAMAVVYLKQNVSVNSHVSPVCLDLKSKHQEIQNGTLLHMAGYGDDRITPSLTDQLKEIPLTFIDGSTCRQISKSLNSFLTPDKFCLLSTTESSPGFGDSGDGVIVEQDGHPFLLGVMALQEKIGSLRVNAAFYPDVAWLNKRLSD